MNRYEIRYYPIDRRWWGYLISRNGQPLQGAEMPTRRAAVKDAQLALQKLQRSEQQLVAA